MKTFGLSADREKNSVGRVLNSFQIVDLDFVNLQMNSYLIIIYTLHNVSLNLIIVISFVFISLKLKLFYRIKYAGLILYFQLMPISLTNMYTIILLLKK